MTRQEIELVISKVMEDYKIVDDVCSPYREDWEVLCEDWKISKMIDFIEKEIYSER